MGNGARGAGAEVRFPMGRGGGGQRSSFWPSNWPQDGCPRHRSSAYSAPRGVPVLSGRSWARVLVPGVFRSPSGSAKKKIFLFFCASLDWVPAEGLRGQEIGPEGQKRGRRREERRREVRGREEKEEEGKKEEEEDREESEEAETLSFCGSCLLWWWAGWPQSSQMASPCSVGGSLGPRKGVQGRERREKREKKEKKKRKKRKKKRKKRKRKRKKKREKRRGVKRLRILFFFSCCGLSGGPGGPESIKSFLFSFCCVAAVPSGGLKL